MNWTDDNWVVHVSNIKAEQSTRKQLREFGYVMAIALFIVSILMWKSDSSIWWYVSIAGMLMVVMGYAFPMRLAKAEKVWMAFAEVLSHIVLRVVLTVVFLCAIIPMGLLLYLIKKDVLCLTRRSKCKSYWHLVDNKEGPGTRHWTPY